MRSGKINVIGVIIVIVLAIAGIWAYTFGPYYWDAVHMKEVVQATCLTFQDRGEPKALGRLTSELYKREIPEYIVEDDCRLDKRRDVYTVTCSYVVEENWPFTSKTQVMEFNIVASRGPHGWIEK